MFARYQKLTLVLMIFVLGALAAPWLSRWFARNARSKPFVSVASEPLTSDLSNLELRGASGQSIRSTSASLHPTGGEEWVFFITSNDSRERAWSTEHFEFDFMKEGREPFHIFGTYLELDKEGAPSTLVVVYKEHGATCVSVVRKDLTLPKALGQWFPLNVQKLAEDEELNGSRVIGASITGRFSDQTLHVRLITPGPTKAFLNFSCDRQGGWKW